MTALLFQRGAKWRMAPPLPLPPVAPFGDVQGRPCKWWCFELRFDKPLTRRLQRRLFNAIGWFCSCDLFIGRDGAFCEQSTKWPYDREIFWFFKNLERFRPYRLRALPYGYRCPCADCQQFRLGDSGCCDPIFEEQDWIYVTQ